MRRWSGLFLVVAVTACSGFVPQPEPDCDTTHLDSPPALTCEVAVNAAVESLPAHGPITALQFLYGSLCPPNARCMGPDGTAGTVIVTYGDGGQQSVYVWLDGGQLIADASVPYPPSWAD